MGLTNEQYDRLIRSFDRRRMLERERQAARVAEAYARIPELESQEERIADLTLDYGRLRLSGSPQERASAADALMKARRKREQLLAAAGLPADYLELRYQCRKCGDTGFLDGAPCICMKKAVTEFLFEQSNLKDRLAAENFRTFSFEYFDRLQKDKVSGLTVYENMTDHYETARAMAQHFRPGEKNLLLIGPVGTGKSFLSNCIAESVMQQGFSVLYLSSAEFFEELAGETFDRNQDTDDSFKFSCDLLILDDLGTELNNDFVKSALFRCLNERALRSRSTIISTNLDLNEIRDAYQERVASRLMERYQICRFFGTDLRILKRKKNNIS